MSLTSDYKHICEKVYGKVWKSLSKFPTAAMFMSAFKSHTMWNIEFIATFMAYLHTRFCMSSCDGSLDTAVKGRAKQINLMSLCCFT
jgi:hypothetical protein